MRVWKLYNPDKVYYHGNGFFTSCFEYIVSSKRFYPICSKEYWDFETLGM